MLLIIQYYKCAVVNTFIIYDDDLYVTRTEIKLQQKNFFFSFGLLGQWPMEMYYKFTNNNEN